MNSFSSAIKNAFRETDFLLLFLCFLTSAFGILMVTSATMPDLTEGQSLSRDASTMLLAVGAGFAVALAVSFIDYNIILRLYPLIAGGCLLLMAATLVWGVGPAERQDAKTWLAIGSRFYFQPSELLKIGFLITFSVHIERVRDRLTQLRHILLLAAHAAVPVGLVAISGDMGSALVFLVIFIVMMFIAGVQLRYFIVGGALVVAALPAVWTFVFDAIQKERFLGLVYPERYEDIMYQQMKGMQAIRGGGLFGQGLFHGALTQAGVVPESENDMIFTVIGEEAGFLGCMAALVLLLLLMLRITRTGISSRLTSTRLLCFGLAAMIAGQTVINIGMCLVIFPVIGITLPFFSAGGSSNLCLYLGVGLVLSIYRFDKEKELKTFRLSEPLVFE